jgi:hypothetical protein
MWKISLWQYFRKRGTFEKETILLNTSFRPELSGQGRLPRNSGNFGIRFAVL